MKNNFYLIANFARSFDIFHYNSNKPHLVSSIFYTEDLNREKLENLPLEEDRNLNIIYILTLYIPLIIYNIYFFIKKKLIFLLTFIKCFE